MLFQSIHPFNLERRMKKLFRTLAIPVIGVAVIASSCGPDLAQITSDLIAEGRNDEAIARMNRALVLEPDVPEYKRLMGIALYNKRLYSESVLLFQRVLRDDDEDDQAAYYLAASYEALRDYNRAIQYYRLYNELTFFGEYKDIVEARIKLLYRQQMEAEAQRALEMEKQLDVSRIPNNTIAILYFENKGQKQELNPLQKGLAEMVITDLTKVKSLKVVERLRLHEMMQELNLSETDLVDQRTAPRLGKLLGAYRLVKGSFFELSGDNINIDAFVARTKTGELDATTNISGSMKDFFRMEKDLVFKILSDLKITLTDEEREAILEIPTQNFFAFLQYSRGLDYEDRGLYTQAFQAYSQAATSDPNFSQAKTSASSAKKVEAIVGTTTEATTSEKQSSEQTTQTQQQSSTSASKSGSGKTAPQSAAPPPPPPPPNSPGGGGGSPTSPGGAPSIGGSGNQIQDRATQSSNSITNTTVPGTGSSNTPQTTVITPLAEPPKPPR
jgi:tetratricopeptide (TPR) repeat protein